VLALEPRLGVHPHTAADFSLSLMHWHAVKNDHTPTTLFPKAGATR